MQNKTFNSTKERLIFEEYKKFILEDFHPCLMAKTIFAGHQVEFHTYDKMGDLSTSTKILSDLDQYLIKATAEQKTFYSFVAVFPHLKFEDEAVFEKTFWQQLQQLHDLDAYDWDSAVSSNPADADFSFSLRGQGFYLIGMHPSSSRIARQAPYPTIVFNLHNQFEQLRAMGTYENLRTRIRKRDLSLQGNNNPMLADFGVTSEARQYSGKANDASWKCPFHSKVINS